MCTPSLLLNACDTHLILFNLQGAKSQMAEHWPCDKKGGPGMFGLYYEDCSDLYNASAWIGAVVGLGVALIGGGIGVPLLKRQYAKGLIM